MTDKTPRRRKPLTLERILDAAFEVVETVGLQEFSTRKLAKALNCEAMSIYHHFPSKAHLTDAMVDRVIGEFGPPPDLPFRAQLEAVARDYRQVCLRYPSFFVVVSTHRLNTPQALGWLNQTLGMFRRAGFDERTAAHAFRVMGYYLNGAILDETNGYAKGPSSVQVVTPEMLARDYPDVWSAGAHFSRENWDSIFELGLGMMLDGFEALLGPTIS
jgi:AcrR family transcriptional regulator